MNFPISGTSIVLIIISFILGYAFIALEFKNRINKAASAILTAIVCWFWIFIASPDKSIVSSHLNLFMGEISQIIFFILGAMVIVEIISAHQGFQIVTSSIKVESKRTFLWVISFFAFFLSSVIDNLTATIVVVSLLQRMIHSRNDRLIIGGAVVIAANAGGAWTPIGDITTTMLWIGGQISTIPTVSSLFIPSLGNLVAALIPLTFCLHGKMEESKPKKTKILELEPRGREIFFIGIAFLLFVPVFKYMTGLPPFLGVLLGLSILWVITDLLHHPYPERKHLHVPDILMKVDVSSVLFFLGILLAVDALNQAHILQALAMWLDQSLKNSHLIAVFIGIFSAIVDNIPLVAASMGMYESQFVQDDSFWQLLAYCAGTGGSILIIGSAAGIVFMALEKVDFFWFVKKISIPAIIGYFAGIFLYLLQLYLFS